MKKRKKVGNVGKNKLIAGIAVSIVLVLSFFMPFIDALTTTIGGAVFFLFPGLLLWKADLPWLEKIVAAIILSMSIIALLYFVFYSIFGTKVLLFFVLVGAGEIYMLKRS